MLVNSFRLNSNVTPGSRKCSSCKTEIPESQQYRTCEKCRLRNQQYKRKERTEQKNQKERAAVEDHTVWSTVAENDSDEEGLNAQHFDGRESFLNAVRVLFRSKEPVMFHGSFTTIVDPLVTDRERVQMTAQEIWRVSGYRFILSVKNHKILACGHCTRYWCSQDEHRKRKPKKSTNPAAKLRETTGMKRYPCRSKLVITCRNSNSSHLTVSVVLKHDIKHTTYTDVSMPPGAIDMIHNNAERLTPVAMLSMVQKVYPVVTAMQVYRAWGTLSQTFWRRDDLQVPSARMLLSELQEDVDILEVGALPDGIEMVCWGMKRINYRLCGQVVEVGIDATYNTNSKHLELYTIMAEYDNAGFPLSYCLLSTASAISFNKRTKCLTAWAQSLKDKYSVTPVFVHIDKDMAEINAARAVWNAKISICWWHMKKAVRERLKLSKLSTTPYKPETAHREFPFIDLTFTPPGQPDITEREGGGDFAQERDCPPDGTMEQSTINMTPKIRLPARKPISSTQSPFIDLSTQITNKEGDGSYGCIVPMTRFQS